jgi:hypothetical protein
VFADDLDVIHADLVGRQHTGRIAAVDARLFDVLHDAADGHVLAIAQCIHIDFKSVVEKMIDQHRMA